MRSDEIAALCRCGACGGRIDRLNIMTLDRRAEWKYPTAGNVLTGEEGRACAVLCDACIDAEREPGEAVEFVGGGGGIPPEVVYHALDSLDPMPPDQPERVQVASPGWSLCRSEAGQVGITCHRCGLTSWNPNDVDNLYCGNCHQFHQG